MARGHRVCVYGRRHVIGDRDPNYRGVELRLLPAPRHKYLETPVHTLLSLLHLWLKPVDVALVCNAANSPFVWLARLRGIPVAVNLDGIERRRAKWNAVGRLWYRFGEICSVLFANRMVADADVIESYYRTTYHRRSAVIRYGCTPLAADLAAQKTGLSGPQTVPPTAGAGVLAEENLAPGSYLLYVSRLEPENNALIAIRAYNQLPSELKRMPLVIVGDAPYAKEYIAQLKQEAGDNVRFLGYRFGEHYRELAASCYLYIQATEVGGTHPALVEAMGFANCVVANDTPEHREVLDSAGVYYGKNSVEELSQKLRELIADFPRVQSLRRAAYDRALAHFDWDKITSDYERLFAELTPRGAAAPPSA